jgi:opacity protein-like surface antigen
MIKKWAMLAGIVMLMSPGAAHAGEWLFTPAIGGSFGAGNDSFTWGASIGWVGEGKYGFEFEWATTPGVLGNNIRDSIDLNLLPGNFDRDLVDDSGNSFMFNGVVGGPRRGANNRFRPYFSGGIGWIKTQVESDTLLFEDSISNNNFGFDLGGGVMTYFSHVGLRGDVRYYKSVADAQFNDILDFDVVDYDYWRATGGVTFRW